jgi:O-antigen/teichoic acid export membrane protein
MTSNSGAAEVVRVSPGQSRLPGLGAPRPRLRTNLRWTLISSAAGAAGNWLLIIVLARASGSVAVGSYALALALTAPLLGSGSLTAFQLRTLVASDPTGRYSFREYRWASVLGDVIGILAMGIVVQASQAGSGAWNIMLPVVAMRAAETLGEAYFGLWQMHERMKVLAIARVLQGAVAVAFAAAATSLGAGAPGAALGGALGAGAALGYLHLSLLGDAPVRAAADRRDHPFSFARIGRIVLEGLPLGVIVLLGVLQMNIPRYFVERHAGTAALGLFAAASQLTTAGNMVVAALATASLPRLAAWYAAGDHSYWTTTRKLVLGSAAMGIAGISLSALLGREILVLLYRPEFAAAHQTLVVLSVAAALGFICAILGLALTSARILAPQNIVLAATLAVLTAASWWFVPRWGEVGAAWALVAALLVEAIGFALALPRKSLWRREPGLRKL